MKVRRLVTKQAILEKISQYDIFKAYVSNFKEVGKAFCSELRKDRKPTCYINLYGEKLFYRDFATSDVWDCFDYIINRYHVDYYEALEMVNLDFNLNLAPQRQIRYNSKPAVKYDFDITTVPKAPTVIKVQLRNWNQYDKSYWSKKYGITIKELTHFKVFPLAGFWINDSYVKAGNNSYGYYFGLLEDGRQGWKIYQPNEKDFKWFGNIPETVFQGYDQLPWIGDQLIITKSLKDVIVLSKLGYPAISPQGETVKLSHEFVDGLRRRFKEIILLYDNDPPGLLAAAELHAEHGIRYSVLIGAKDASDYVEIYGIEALGDQIHKLWETNIKF